MACLPDFCEALQTRAAELRRKVRDEQKKQEVAHRKVSLVEDEVARLRAEALELQLAADKQRQERKAQREAKVDVASLKKEVNRRHNQVLILTEELARMQADVRGLVSEAVRQAEKAALAREAEVEQQWSTREEVEQDKFRKAEQTTLSLEQDSACLEHEMRALPRRAAAVQLFAVLDQLRHVRQVAERMQTFRREEACLLELRSRRLCEKDEKLTQLDEEAAEQRCKAAEHRAAFEEEARREEQELIERLERNRKRAERAEREAARHLKESRDASSGPKPKEGRDISAPTLPPVAPSGSRSVRKAEFVLAGALKALDHELSGRLSRASAAG